MLLLGSNAAAQILNINNIDITADSSRYWLLGAELFFEADNRSPNPDEEASLLTFESGFDLTYVSDNHAYIMSNQFNYYEVTGDPLISTGFTHFRMNFFRKRDTV